MSRDRKKKLSLKMQHMCTNQNQEKQISELQNKHTRKQVIKKLQGQAAI
jgi:hypothetical protein